MIHIAIVDDMADDRAALSAFIIKDMAQRNLPYVAEEFISGEDFLASFAPQHFSVAFLDIYMGELNGIEVARKIYDSDPTCKIVFLTTSREHMLDSFSVNPTYYLVKPFVEEKLRQALDFCFPQPKPTDFLTIRTKNGTMLVARTDICYIQHVGRYGYVRLSDGEIESLQSFGELTAPLLEDKRFLTCFRGVMVNLHFIQKQEDCDFIMTDGSRQPISRRSKGEVLKVFEQFALDSMGRWRL